MAPRTVPSKIVIAGNSKMSLNERFSSIPKPRPIQKKPKFAPKHVYQHVQYAEPIEFAPRAVARRPQQNYQRRAVPLQSRVSFVKAVPQRQFVQRSPQFQFVKKPFNKFPQNQRNNTAFKPRFNNNGIQANRPLRGKVFPTMPKKKTLAELDRELEDYMRKPKHPPIII